MPIADIAQGFYNNLTKKKEQLYKDRIKICKTCKLYKVDNVFGPICNKSLFVNPETEEVSRTRQPGFYSGCGCLLGAKTRVENTKCPLRRW